MKSETFDPWDNLEQWIHKKDSEEDCEDVFARHEREDWENREAYGIEW